MPIILLAQCTLAMVADFPPAPASHVYDPDFLLTRRSSAEMTAVLAKFETENGIAVRLAVFTVTPKEIEETAMDLDDSWNRGGAGAVIVFVPASKQARVMLSPPLSLLEEADQATKIFRDAAKSALRRGDFSAAAADGTAAVLKSLRDARERAAALEKPTSQPSRKRMLFAVLAIVAVVGGIFLGIAARIWRTANLFGRCYRFPACDAPAAMRFGGTRCGGQMATIKFSEKSEAKDG